MASGYAVRNITVTTGAVNTTFTISGLSFAPVGVHTFWSGKAAVGTTEQNHRFGHGIFTGTAARRAYASQSEHAAATSACDHVPRNDCAVCVLSITGTSVGKLDVDAMLSDGVRFIVDEVFTTALYVSVELWGGDVSQAQIVDITQPGATGNQDIATSFALNTGLDDKAVFFLGGRPSSFGTVAPNAYTMYGVAAGNTPVNAVAHALAIDANGSGLARRYSIDGECLAGSDNPSSVKSRASVTAWLSTGFRLNWAEVDPVTSWGYSALVLKGGRFEAGSLLTILDTSNEFQPTTYVPVGLSFGSACGIESVSDTTSTMYEFSIGAAKSASERAYAAVRDRDTPTTMDVCCSSNTTAFMVDHHVTTATLENQADLVSLDATPGFTWVMDVTEGTIQRWFFYVVVADAPGITISLVAAITGGSSTPGALSTSTRKLLANM